MMKRYIFAIVITTLFILPVLFLGPGGQAAERTAKGVKTEVNKLRVSIKVSGPTIQLGDLFTGTGDKADIAVAYTPEPGKRAVFDARWLYRIAHAYKLNWKPLGVNVRAVVERKSQAINPAEVAAEILSALVAKGADADMEIDMGNRLARIYVPDDAIAAVDVEDVSYDRQSGRFSAIFNAPAGSPTAKRHRVTGRLHKTTEIPVLNRRMLTDELITGKDIKWITVRSVRLQANTVTSDADLVGKSPRRGLRAGYPVLSSAVKRPVLVPKGSLVTLILQIPKMTLTARGKALQPGSDGDVIRVKNLQSSSVVEGEVIASGQVKVRLTTIVAMN